MPTSKIFRRVFFALLTFSYACQSTPYPVDVNDPEDNDANQVADVGGNPSSGSQDIYSTADLSNLCVDEDLCAPPYDELPSWMIHTDGQEPLDDEVCNFDYDPNLVSTFILNRPRGDINGLKLLLSKEDLFFIAWVSMRYKINPYFLMGVISQESAGNCSAVSGSSAEGCFQITNTFGQAQLDESYRDRVSEWFWSDRTDFYYPNDLFVDGATYFGEAPESEQFRVTIDPFAHIIEGLEVSSVVNFHFGAIASAFYYHWQQYLLFYNFDDLRDAASDIFESPNGKALWQSAAYNGGAYGAANALEEAGADFLDEMGDETQDYAPAVVDYCTSYQAGTLTYSAAYTEDDLKWIMDLLASTYPSSRSINWDEVKDDVHQLFFAAGATELSFVDDIKAIVYVISTHAPELAPEWPEL